MKIVAGQIYFLDRPRLRQAAYGHPIVVLRVERELITIGYLSTKFDLKINDDHTIHESDEGFEMSGLKESSYIIHRHVVKVNHGVFQNAPLLGRVAGAVKKRIEEWWGENLE